jgi:hypothetical protein
MPPFVPPPHTVPPCAVVVPPLSMPPLAVVVPPLAVVVPPPCRATPCRTTFPSLVTPPSLMLQCASLVLAGCCITLSLFAPTSLSCQLVVESPPLLPHRRFSCCIAASLITPPLSHHAVPNLLYVLPINYSKQE